MIPGFTDLLKFPGFVYWSGRTPVVSEAENIKQLDLPACLSGCKPQRFQHCLAQCTWWIWPSWHSGARELRSLRRRKKLHLLLSFCMIQRHGPFSHALESSIITGTHEDLSLLWWESWMKHLREVEPCHRDIQRGISRRFLHELMQVRWIWKLDYLAQGQLFTEYWRLCWIRPIIRMLNTWTTLLW